MYYINKIDTYLTLSMIIIKNINLKYNKDVLIKKDYKKRKGLT